MSRADILSFVAFLNKADVCFATINFISVFESVFINQFLLDMFNDGLCRKCFGGPKEFFAFRRPN